MYRMYRHNYLAHHGVKGMHWGVRRYQNPDGSLTLAGEKRATQLANKSKKLSEKSEKYAGKYSKLTGGGDVTKHKKTGREVNSNPDRLSSMSDEDLKQAIDRYKLETSYIKTRRENAEARNYKPPTPQKPKSNAAKVGDYLYNTFSKPASDAMGDLLRDSMKKYGGEALGITEKQKKDKVWEKQMKKAKENAEYWKNLNTAEQQEAQYKARQKKKEKEE